MVTASPDHVRVEIDTHLDDPEINDVIERVDRDIDREMTSPPSDDTNDRQDLEAALAALWIASTRDRSEDRVQSGRTTVTYEEGVIDKLRSRARRLGAPDALIDIGQSLPSPSLTVHDAKGID